MSSLMLTVSLPSASKERQLERGSPPRLMFTPVIKSAIVTACSDPHAPTQRFSVPEMSACGVMVSGGVAVLVTVEDGVVLASGVDVSVATGVISGEAVSVGVGEAVA